VRIFLLVTTANAVATLIAGAVAPLLTQVLKKMVGWSDTAALMLTVAVSVVVAFVSMWLVGEIQSLADVATSSAAVFGLATLVYKLFIAGGQ
jgi:hypothetical protein